MVRAQTFIKTINYQHLMPTRYNLADVDLKKHVNAEVLENPEQKKAANKVREAVSMRACSSKMRMAPALRISCTACHRQACRRRKGITRAAPRYKYPC